MGPGPRHPPRYQWYRSGVAISGATASTYKLTTSDQAKTMTVTVAAPRAGYTTAAKTSVATSAVVLGALTAPTPTIFGHQGGRLHPHRRSRHLAPGPRHPRLPVVPLRRRHLRRHCQHLQADDQRPSQDHDGQEHRHQGGHLSVAKTSVAMTAVLASPPAPTPTIWDRKVASTLAAIVGTWTPVAATYTYQWYRSGVAISGATAKTYTLATLDKGKLIKVRVTGVRTGYLTLAKYSAQTGAIA